VFDEAGEAEVSLILRRRSRRKSRNHCEAQSVDWTNNKTIHDRISQDIDDLFYAYEKQRAEAILYTIDKIIENVKTVALRRF
jgi:type I restriction enzyme R subunit